MICKQCHSELTLVEQNDSCPACHASSLCMGCMEGHYCQKPIKVNELIQRLSSFPQNLEVWCFDYGDDKGYSLFEVDIWEPEDKSVYGIDRKVLMLK